MALLSFAGFCRHSDAAILRWSDVSFTATHVELQFIKRKNNQYKMKQRVRIARLPGRAICVQALLEAWKARTYAGPDSAVFRGFDGRTAGRNPAACSLGKEAISYGQYSYYLNKLLAPRLGLTEAQFKARFGTQSCRSGGASAAANAGVPFEVWGQHGAWRSRDAQLVYMGLDLPSILSTTKAILGSMTEGEAILLSSDSESDSEDTL
jgi:hypothetical protein